MEEDAWLSKTLPRSYVTVSEEPFARERLDDRGFCQPSFFIIGAMKAATTHMAEELSRLGLTIHPYEHHFWEYYPAFEWESGGDARAASFRARKGELSRRMVEAEAAVVSVLRHGNGSYPPWSNRETAEMHLCEDIVHSLAPRRGIFINESSVQDVCTGARQTLATSLVLHHSRFGMPKTLHDNATSPATAARIRRACRGQVAIGIKAPSHISEYYVPLRIRACSAPAVRFLISLRDPISRAYSAWRYKHIIPAHAAHTNGNQTSLAFADMVGRELAGLHRLDLSNTSAHEDPRLWMELYIRLLWQGALREKPDPQGRKKASGTPSGAAAGGHHTSSLASPSATPRSDSPATSLRPLRFVEPLVRCRPLEYGGHDKLAGVVKGLYAAQVGHWLDAFDNDCSRFLITIAEVHTGQPLGGADAAARDLVLKRTLEFLGVPLIVLRKAQASRGQARDGHAKVTSVSHGEAAANARHKQGTTLADGTYRRLRDFYRPANAALARLLEQRCRCVPLTARTGETGAAGSAERLSGGLMQLPSALVAAGYGRWLVEGSSSAFQRQFIAYCSSVEG